MQINHFDNQSLLSILPSNGWGIYIHVPFCLRRCKYCAFISSVPKTIPSNTYVQAILDEYALRKTTKQNRKLLTLYFGGGTPTMLPDKALERIISTITKTDGVPLEVTLEANPEHVSTERAKNWKSMGFTRISMGIQSFDDNMLRFLGRKHDKKQAIQAVDILSSSGFDEICIDLIYGGCYETSWSPKQSLNQWINDLSIAKSLPATHFSCYELTLEPHTPLWTQQKHGQKITCDDETIAEMMEMIPSALNCFRYEISNYSKNGYFSGHNLSCWSGLPYLGLGPGAHSLSLSSLSIQRHANIGNYHTWENALLNGSLPTPLFIEDLTPQKHLSERLMCAARTCLWWSPQEIAYQLNEPITPFLPGIQKAIDRKLLETRRDGYMRTTPKGILLNNTLDELIFDFY